VACGEPGMRRNGLRILVEHKGKRYENYYFYYVNAFADVGECGKRRD
jgi:hypothetical protein